jgi:hypothetical protein
MLVTVIGARRAGLGLVSSPVESWDEEAQHAWLAVFSVTVGPAVTVHGVTPVTSPTAGCSVSSSGETCG